MSPSRLSRRDALRLAGTGAGAAFLAACGSGPAAPVTSGNVTLDFWTHDEGYQTFFERGIPAADAATSFRYAMDTTRAGAQDLITKLLAQAVAERGKPDVIGIEIGQFARLQRGDLAERLLFDWTDRVADLGDDLIAARKAPYTKDGKLYALDSDTPMTVYYYRDDLFAKYGLPTDVGSWDELAQVGARAAEQHGVSLGVLAAGSDLGQIVQGYQMLLLQRGGRFFDEDENLVLDSPEAVEVLQFVVDGLESGFITTVNDFYGASMQAGLKSEKIAGLWMASWYSAFGLKPNVPEQSGAWRLRAMPAWSGGGFATAVGGGTGFAAIVEEANTQAAADFIASTWITHEGQVRRFQELTYLPTLRSVFDSPELEVADEYFGGQQLIDVYRTLVDDVPEYYQSPDVSILNDVLSGYLVSAYRGDLTPAQAIKGAVEDFTNQAGR
ncbi:ABC transporter substrate-binding protein [Kineococcus sp. SYSU DK003]|uniref:ABC transporter substrate-binding protein n=1 Tax=Kineococcus sp. SYSU DK003 TaxID=3383124 RepID=UPI003D7F118D